MDRLSCCTFPLQTMPIDAALTAISSAGFRKADVLGRAPHLVVAEPAPLQAAAEACKVKVANLGTYAGEGFASTDASVQDAAFAELCQTLDLASSMGARSIRVKAVSKRLWVSCSCFPTSAPPLV